MLDLLDVPSDNSNKETDSPHPKKGKGKNNKTVSDKAKIDTMATVINLWFMSLQGWLKRWPHKRELLMSCLQKITNASRIHTRKNVSASLYRK